MPQERISRSFKDISMSLGTNPLTGDVLALTNINSINRSIRNLVYTERGERFFNQTLGCGITRLLFDPLDNITAQSVKEEIETTINNFEPRVKLDRVEVVPNFDDNELNVTIVYDVIGAPLPKQQLSFALTPTR